MTDWSRRSRRHGSRSDDAAGAVGAADPGARRAREGRTGGDGHAIRTSEEELNLAVGEFGADATAPFTAAYDRAKATLASAFAIRQRLDDDIPETPEQQRQMLVELITTCERADR
ncbi:hypothetical protein GS508_25255 [Rhodococcus hoagii]|nr:hypothetical protein [Prescottella equi]